MKRMSSARCWRAGGKNGFGHAFVRAAERTNAHMAHDGFDSAVCKVAAADHERFHEHVVLDSDVPHAEHPVQREFAVTHVGEADNDRPRAGCTRT